MYRHCLIALSLAASATPGRAQTPVQTAFQALAQDAAEYAKAFGVAPDAALRRLAAQAASVAATDALARLYADRLAGLVIEPGEPFRITLLLTGDSPVPDQLIQAAGLDVPVHVRVGAAATRQALVAAIVAHQAELRALLSAPPGMGVDARTGSLVVMVKPSDIPAAGAATLAAQFAAIAGVPVEIRTLGAIDSDLAAEGGGRLVGLDPATGQRNLCTAGFVVTDGGRTGLTTAAHCPDRLSFVAPGGAQMPLTMIGAWGARYQDVQIHVGDEAMAPHFLVDRARTIARDVTSWRNRDSTRVGEFVCHRGERTGYSCATVAYVDYAPPGDLCAGPCPPTWVAVRGPDCGGGDSGGPIFSGTVAFGLMKGASYSTAGACILYYYMSTDYLPPGWTLLYRGAGDPAPSLTAPDR